MIEEFANKLLENLKKESENLTQIFNNDIIKKIDEKLIEVKAIMEEIRSLSDKIADIEKRLSKLEKKDADGITS